MQTIILNLSSLGESDTAPSVNYIAEVQCTFNSTSLTIELNRHSKCRPSASDFNNILTAAEPGNNVDSLLWSALEQYQFRYKHEVQQTASTTWLPMEFCYPDLETGIAQLCFDKLETGQACAVEDTATGKLYTRMRVLNNNGTLGPETDLRFTSGQILLIG